MNLPIKAFLGALSLCLTTLAQAQLAWEKTEIELNPPPGTDSVVANFKYENKGDKVVNIKSVRTSCGCTTAALKKNDVAPGEKGEIVATFKAGDRTGMQMKTVTIDSDDPKSPVTTLTLKANIAVLLDLQPQFVFWTANEDPKPKTITAKTGKGVTIKSLEVTSSTPDFTTKVEPGSTAGEFRIVVQPKETGHQATAELTIKPDKGAGEGKLFKASARVMPPAVPTAQAPSAPAPPTTANH
jgi:hypothetical protein